MPLVFSIVKTREERYALFVAQVKLAIERYRHERATAQAMYDHQVDLLAEAAQAFDELEARLAHDQEHFFDGSELGPSCIHYSL